MEINVLILVFTTMYLTIGFLGALVKCTESYLPSFIIPLVRFGKHLDDSNKNKNSITSVPKSWFKHFYVFAAVWSLLWLVIAVKCIFVDGVCPEVVALFLNILRMNKKSSNIINSTSTFVACTLFTLQCWRRFYETQWLQVFSEKNKIHIGHYVIAYLHYFGAVVAVFLHSEGFVPGTKATEFNILNLKLSEMIWIPVFFYSYYHQWQSNVILANLRKNSTGIVVTKKHLLPQGGYFEMVTSPHMFFEVVMYISITAILEWNWTWIIITIWVITNQCITANLTQQWYKDNFKNYPKGRRAIIPKIL